MSQQRPTLSDQLRELIQARGLSAYALGRAAGIERSTITRFLAREAGLSSESLDRIGAALDLRLTEGPKGRRARPAAAIAATATATAAAGDETTPPGPGGPGGA